MSVTQGLQLPFGIQPVNPVPVDAWSGPYAGDLAQDAVDLANASIPLAIRYQSMEVRLIIDGVSRKYWYRDGIQDSDLVEFTSGSGDGGSSRSQSGVLTELVLNEVPSGVLDGVNKTFYLAFSPANSREVMVWLNGQLLTQGIGRDYQISGNSITFSVFSPLPTDVLLCMYSKQVVVKKFSLNESLTIKNTGGSLWLEVNNIPNPTSSLMLFRNGQLLTQTSDYTIAQKEIHILNNAIELDDIFLATYSYEE